MSWHLARVCVFCHVRLFLLAEQGTEFLRLGSLAFGFSSSLTFGTLLPCTLVGPEGRSLTGVPAGLAESNRLSFSCGSVAMSMVFGMVPQSTTGLPSF